MSPPPSPGDLLLGRDQQRQTHWPGRRTFLGPIVGRPNRCIVLHLSDQGTLKKPIDIKVTNRHGGPKSWGTTDTLRGTRYMVHGTQFIGRELGRHGPARMGGGEGGLRKLGHALLALFVKAHSLAVGGIIAVVPLNRRGRCSGDARIASKKPGQG